MELPRKKIIQLISSIQVGGAEMVAFNIAEFCNKQDPSTFEFIVIELYASKDPYALEKRNELESKRIRIKSLSRSSKRISLLAAPLQLMRFLLKERPIIIHSHTDLPDFVLATTLKLLRLFNYSQIPIVRTIHNTILWPTHRYFGKYTESAYVDDYIVGVSEASLKANEQLRAKYKLTPSINKRVIYNGCSTSTNELAPFALNKEKINIAFCGRLELQKGVDILIDRMRQINKQYCDKINFYIIGEGAFRPQVQELAHEFDNILYFSPINHLSNKLHVFDFIIMPSRFEGLALLSLEASLVQVPVIAASAPGLIETLPKDWPLLFKLEDPSSLIAIIRKIVNCEYDIHHLKTQVQSFVSEKFSFDQMIASYWSLYHDISEKQPPYRAP